MAINFDMRVSVRGYDIYGERYLNAKDLRIFLTDMKSEFLKRINSNDITEARKTVPEIIENIERIIDTLTDKEEVNING